MIGDVTIPAGTVLNQGVSFIKTWRLQNIGSCSWTTGYALVFYTGNLMDGPAVLSLPITLTPAVRLTSASTSPLRKAPERTRAVGCCAISIGILIWCGRGRQTDHIGADHGQQRTVLCRDQSGCIGEHIQLHGGLPGDLHLQRENLYQRRGHSDLLLGAQRRFEERGTGPDLQCCEQPDGVGYLELGFVWSGDQRMGEIVHQCAKPSNL